MEIQLKQLYKPIVLAMLVAFLVTFAYKPALVENFSMSPSLEENDLLILNSGLIYNKSLKKGEIIVFKTQIEKDGIKEITMIKRIIGLPGDSIVIGDGEVYINSNRLDETYLKETYTDGEVKLVVPKGKVFVMGDNRAVSLDSRDAKIGLIDENEVIGKAKFRLFPFKRMGFIN